MMRYRSTHAVAAALVATLAVAGCKKSEPVPEAAAPPPAPTFEPAAPEAPVMTTVSVSGVELGTSIGADMNIESPASTFATGDTIIAAVATATSDPAANVTGNLGVRWTYEGDTPVHEESKDIDFSGKGVTTFEISKPDGWPTGNYKVEVLLNGAVAQSREFEVR